MSSISAKKYKRIVLATILAIVLLTAVAVYRNWQKSNASPTICTMEALLCPDGSYVGRQGKDCAFTACSGTSFTGKLIQTPGNDFQLIVESPDKNLQGVAYAIPLDSISTPDFVGKKVTVSGAFIEGNIFKVSTIESAGDVTLGKVGVGETVFINGVLITLNSIVSDSRCQEGVQCIWAGSVVANVFLRSDTDSETVNIETGKAAIGFDSFLVSIESVSPAKTVSGPDLQDYILTLKVVER